MTNTEIQVNEFVRSIDTGILTGLGQCCEATNRVLESEDKDD